MLDVRLFQWCIVIIGTVEVLSDTKSSTVCKNHTEALELTTETGDILFAGTDCDYSLLLRNDNGAICQAYTLNNYGNDRERNSIDQYRICCPKNFLDQNNGLSMLAFIQLGVRGKYPGPCTDDWFIESIELRIDQRRFFRQTIHDWSKRQRQILFGFTKINNSTYIRF